jgi:hypothetical protein
MSYYVFSFISFSFICNVWIKKKKKTEKWGRGVNCEEEIREKKNEMSEGRCMCVVGEKKKERKK